ncbi:phage related protein [Secundilactobacillus pentosiphilus]|uniref:Phage related protein n=1 Tax=Secundilactobacillus pentosiphilus TaxID=1714682 RepID=A0A1Z5IV52_9LACO|nr:pyocin knob domain-containing protein [Secundilactobacillus pentosiphilus]GAX05472.1 phage related protein [Secundilactobacillus pentosiphilus]
MADDKPIKFTVITDAGAQLVDQLATKSNQITAFRAVGSSANHWDDDLASIRAMTEIDSIEQNGKYMGNYNDGEVTETVQIDFDQQELTNAYQLATVGLFATDANQKEILYAVECLQTSQPMTPSPEHDVSTHLIKVAVGNTSQVTAQFSDAGVVSQTELEQQFKDYTKTDDLPKLIADNIPADILTTENMDQQVPTLARIDKANTFTETQTFKNGAVNSAGKKALFDGDVDLSGTQPKGDYANSADLTALKNAVNSTTTGLPSKMATADADKKYETSAHASSTYQTKADANYHGLADGTDLFTILDKSDVSSITYVVMTNASAATMKNCPTNQAFILRCDSTDYNGGIWSNTVLTLTNLMGQTWVATNATGPDGNLNANPGWHQIATVDNINATVATRMPINSGNVDSKSLDNMKTDGIFALNNFDPTNVAGFPNNLLGNGATWGKLIVLSAGSSMIRQILYGLSGRFVYRSFTGNPGLWGPWIQMATGDDVLQAKQDGINQSHTDMLTELTNRGNRRYWTGTQAQYDAMGSKDGNTEYDITG